MSLRTARGVPSAHGNHGAREQPAASTLARRLRSPRLSIDAIERRRSRARRRRRTCARQLVIEREASLVATYDRALTCSRARRASTSCAALVRKGEPADSSTRDRAAQRGLLDDALRRSSRVQGVGADCRGGASSRSSRKRGVARDGRTEAIDDGVRRGGRRRSGDRSSASREEAAVARASSTRRREAPTPVRVPRAPRLRQRRHRDACFAAASTRRDDEDERRP